MRQKSLGRLRWEEAYSTPRPPAGFMGKTGKEEGRGRAGNGKKKRKKEGEWQRGCKAGKAGIEGEGKR